MAKTIIMAWSKCSFEIGTTLENDGMATELVSVGKIKDKSSTLEPSDGDALEMKATGGELVAKETNEGGYMAKTRVIEPSAELLTKLGIAEVVSEEGVDKGDLRVKTHIVSGNWSLKVTPKNVGARGIKAPKTSIAYKPGWSEEDGHYVDLEFDILKGDADYWYSMFTKAQV